MGRVEMMKATQTRSYWLLWFATPNIVLGLDDPVMPCAVTSHIFTHVIHFLLLLCYCWVPSHSQHRHTYTHWYCHAYVLYEVSEAGDAAVYF